MLLLSGCTRWRYAACIRNDRNVNVSLDIEARNDTITKIEVIESLFLDDRFLRGIDDSFLMQLYADERLLEDRIVHEYEAEMKEEYSFMKTIEELKKEGFYCE